MKNKDSIDSTNIKFATAQIASIILQDVPDARCWYNFSMINPKTIVMQCCGSQRSYRQRTVLLVLLCCAALGACSRQQSTATPTSKLNATSSVSQNSSQAHIEASLLRERIVTGIPYIAAQEGLTVVKGGAGMVGSAILPGDWIETRGESSATIVINGCCAIAIEANSRLLFRGIDTKSSWTIYAGNAMVFAKQDVPIEMFAGPITIHTLVADEAQVSKNEKDTIFFIDLDLIDPYVGVYEGRLILESRLPNVPKTVLGRQSEFARAMTFDTALRAIFPAPLDYFEPSAAERVRRLGLSSQSGK